jgi:hypothetical protein
LTPTAQNPGKMAVSTAVITLLTAFVGCVGAFFIAYPQLSAVFSGRPVVEITSPASPKVGRSGTIVRGTSENLGENDLLWVASSAIGDGVYHPHVRPCNVSSSGDWTCPEMFIGDDASIGETFRIIVLQVNGAAVTTILDYNSSKLPNEYPGLPQLPAGATIVDEIEVTLSA